MHPNNNKLLLLMSMLLILSFMIISSNSPLLIWFWMEMGNMMFIMMILSVQANLISSSMTMMIIQFMSSTLIIISQLSMFLPNLMTIGVSMKLGLFPFHMWMPMILVKSPWLICFILMTIHKLPPFMFINYINSPTLLLIIITITPITITLKLMYTFNAKIILGLSSSIHSSWMSLCMVHSTQLWAIYFSLYTINLYMTCLLIKSKYMNSPMFNLKKKSILMMVLLSSVGSPPFIGFLGKAMMMSKSFPSMWLPMMSLIMSSALSLVFYSRILLSLISHPLPIQITLINNMNKKKIMNKFWIIILLSMMIT
uniref:NADH-ubiquinone oxidoreductase chain 2 n=1 Tax=Mutilla europaea TaxID=2749339 RepID=A0A7L7S834_9HYME|nr:NADH dehydrogenase subunit 2 [Mutilla europaea]